MVQGSDTTTYDIQSCRQGIGLCNVNLAIDALGSSLADELAIDLQHRLHLQDQSPALSAPRQVALLKAFAIFWRAPFVVLQPAPSGRKRASAAEDANNNPVHANPHRKFSRGLQTPSQQARAGHQGLPRNYFPHWGASDGSADCWSPATGHLQISLTALTVLASNLLHLEICQQPGLTDLLPLKGELLTLEQILLCLKLNTLAVVWPFFVPVSQKLSACSTYAWTFSAQLAAVRSPYMAPSLRPAVTHDMSGVWFSEGSLPARFCVTFIGTPVHWSQSQMTTALDYAACSAAGTHASDMSQ